MRAVNLLPLLILGAAALRLQSRSHHSLEGEFSEKIPIWVYWDEHEFKQDSFFGNLTFEALEQRIDPAKFELKLVNAANIKEHLPDAPEEFFRLYDAAKSDFLRANLIATHGGIYMDGDIMMQENFQTLWNELDHQKSEAMVYLSPGQACNKQFTTNFMMGRKGNRMCMKWADEIKKGLKSTCPYTSDRDDVNGVCCYNPDGSPRKECHIPWGRISRPQTEGVTFAKSFSLKTKLASHACIGADRGFGIDDDTGEMLWQEFDTSKEAAMEKEKGCWMEGPDMRCKNGKFMKNFMKRTGYHLYSSLTYQQRQMSRDEHLFGPKKTVARALFRRLLLGEDATDGVKNGRCGATQEDVDASDYKHLTFIHIPRTGGTAVEACTEGDSKEQWGVQNPALQGLRKLSKTVKLPEMGGACYKQHVPPSLWEASESPYADKETFCIVRNPYSRIISQFKFELAFFKKPTECSAEQLNWLIQTRLNDIQQNGNKFAADCHWTPQSFYVYGVNNETLSLDVKQRSCKNVLTYENLHAPLNALLKEHNYPYRLDKHGHSGTSVSEDCKVSQADISEESRRLIERVYRSDFHLFGYKIQEV